MKNKFKQIKLIFYTFNLIGKCCKKHLFTIVFLSVVNSISPIISLLLPQGIFNMAQQKIQPFNEILKLIIIYVIFILVNICLSNLYSYQLNQLNLKLGYKIKYLLMEKCSNLPFEKLESSTTYDMLTQINDNAYTKPYQTLMAIVNTFIDIFPIIPVFFIIFVWNKWVSFLILFLSFISFKYDLNVANKEFGLKTGRSSEERKAWYYNYLLTHDFAFKEVKTRNLKDYFLNRYKKLIDLFIMQESRINKIKILLNMTMSIMHDGVNLLVTILAIKQVYAGNILIGTAMTYINSTNMIQSSISKLSFDIYNIYDGNLYMALLRDFFSLDDISEEGKINISKINNIKIENLYFDYPHQKEALKNIDIEINNGEIVAIVGANGSGKTTLLKLLCSLYQPSQGRIKINGIDLKQINLQSYKQQMSVLFQDFLKFEGTLLENVYLGNVEKCAKNNDINRALDSANVDFCLKNGHYEYDRTLGSLFDNGAQLSGGQWQKIALARLFYKTASLYLLDEPSSALDVKSEAEIFNSFFERNINAICIYVTHKIKLAKKAHKIIVLARGGITGIGTHEYLYNNCPEYRKLCFV